MPPRKSFKHQFSGLTQAAPGMLSQGPLPGTALLRGAEGGAAEPPQLTALSLSRIFCDSCHCPRVSLEMSSGLPGKSQSILVFFFFFPGCIETGHAKTFKAAGWGCVCVRGGILGWFQM